MSDTEDDARIFDAGLYAEEMPPAPNAPIDTSSPSQHRRAVADQKRAEERRVEVLQAMLATPAGREFLAWVLFDLCGLVKTTLLADGSHTFSDFRAGQRDVALKIHHLLLRADKSGYVVLLSDHVDQM